MYKVKVQDLTSEGLIDRLQWLTRDEQALIRVGHRDGVRRTQERIEETKDEIIRRLEAK